MFLDEVAKVMVMKWLPIGEGGGSKNFGDIAPDRGTQFPDQMNWQLFFMKDVLGM